MATNEATSDDTERERISATEVDEGDRVFMRINLHGTTDGVPGTEYDSDIYQAGAEGTVTEALSEARIELLADGHRPMADVTVETDDGHVFTWNVDNGYVIGYLDSVGRRTDVGRFGGFQEPK